MEKMKQKVDKGKRLFTHKIDSRRLKPGDHIYAYRGFGSYSHHGIYVDEDRVVHYIQTEINSVFETKQPCEKCGYQQNVHRGVVKSCIDCFLSHGAFSSESLCVYQYEDSSFVKMLKRSGTCSTLKSFEPEKVVQTANKLHQDNGFGSYDLVHNNCEHFATFCKTGTPTSEQICSLPISFLSKISSS